MAKFISHILTGASGSVGGTTYAKNRNGLFLRAKTAPTQPRTTAQGNVRAAFTGSAQAWRGLTDAQRAGWHTLGAQVKTTDALGQSSTLTGAQVHLALNGVLATVGTSPISDAPSQPEALAALPPITLEAARQGTAAGAFSLLVHSTAYGGKVQVYVTPAVSAGRSYFGKSGFRLLTVVDGLVNGSTAVTDAYIAKYGTPALGAKIAVKLVPVSPSGFKGAGHQATAIVSIGS